MSKQYLLKILPFILLPFSSSLFYPSILFSSFPLPISHSSSFLSFLLSLSLSLSSPSLYFFSFLFFSFFLSFFLSFFFFFFFFFFLSFFSLSCPLYLLIVLFVLHHCLTQSIFLHVSIYIYIWRSDGFEDFCNLFVTWFLSNHSILRSARIMKIVVVI